MFNRPWNNNLKIIFLQKLNNLKINVKLLIMEGIEKQEFEIIINETFEELDNICRNKNERDSRLIFPTYKSGKIRICEQELRFLFIERLKPFLNNHNYYYSIETPTSDCYRFSDKNIKDSEFVPQRVHNSSAAETVDKKSFKSAAFDLVIHRHKKDDKKEDRVAIIEFKTKGDMHEIAKDICKLGNKYEGTETTDRYFIFVINNTGKTTEESIKEKLSINNNLIDFISFADDKEINVICYSLELENGKEKGKYINLISNIDTKIKITTPELFLK